jgi:hypothetical protein
MELALEFSLSEPLAQFDAGFFESGNIVREDETADRCGVCNQGGIVLNSMRRGGIYGVGWLVGWTPKYMEIKLTVR